MAGWQRCAGEHRKRSQFALLGGVIVGLEQTTSVVALGIEGKVEEANVMVSHVAERPVLEQGVAAEVVATGLTQDDRLPRRLRYERETLLPLPAHVVWEVRC